MGALTGQAASVLSEPDKSSRRSIPLLRGPGLSPGAGYFLAPLFFVWGVRPGGSAPLAMGPPGLGKLGPNAMGYEGRLLH